MIVEKLLIALSFSMIIEKEKKIKVKIYLLKKLLKLRLF